MKHPYINRYPYQVPSTPIDPTIYRSKQNVDTRHAFSDQLQQALQAEQSMIISKHAEKRMLERKIDIEPQKWTEIYEKVHQAKQKGVRDSLVLLKDAALIVSAKNNTVITVMDRHEASEQIFTNINGTIVMD